MSWGTYFNADIFISHKLFNSIVDIDAAIDGLKEDMQSDRECLLMIAMSNPKDIIEGGDDVLYSVRNRINDHLDSLLQSEVQMQYLLLYKEAIQEGNAKFKETQDL
jgi:hypothetical protein